MNVRPKTTFRKARDDDVEAIGQIVRAAYAKWVPLIGREPLPMLADYERAIREHDIDLLYAGDTLVGLIETRPYPDHLWIENIAVPQAPRAWVSGKSCWHVRTKKPRRKNGLKSACSRMGPSPPTLPSMSGQASRLIERSSFI